MPPTVPVALTYDTATSQLTFDNAIIPVVEVDTAIEVTVVNAIFAQPPATLIFPGALDPAQPQLIFTPANDSHNKITITVKTLPAHFLRPWILALNVNLNPGTGSAPESNAVVMNSPSLFVVNDTNALFVSVPGAEPTLSVGVQYDPSDGKFTLGSAFDLASLQVLVIPVSPLTLTFSVDAPDDPVTFDQTPFIFDGGAPSWIVLPEASSIPTNQISLGIVAPPAASTSVPGFASFRFRINVTSGDNTILVTSPDPILVNATIGDGTGT